MNPCFGRTALTVDHTTEERGLTGADAARMEPAAPRLQRLLYCPDHLAASRPPSASLTLCGTKRVQTIRVCGIQQEVHKKEGIQE